MPVRVALLRGINVGGKHKLPMKELVRLMEDNGCTAVKTYIQSGNVVFRSPERVARGLGALIERKFGFRPEVFLLTREALQKAVANNPYAPRDGKHVHFFFFDRAPRDFDRDLLDSLRLESEEFALIDKVFYVHTPEGFGRSKLVEKIGKAFTGVSMTARNLNTVGKLVTLADELNTKS